VASFPQFFPQRRFLLETSTFFKGHPMHPIHDVDAILLLATALASKRRPADLGEIAAALELVQINAYSEERLADSFDRLSKHGLLAEVEGRYTLTPEAQKVMGRHAPKTETPDRVFSIKANLAVYHVKGESPTIVVTEEALRTAILGHRAAVKEVKTTALMPKPKPAEEKRPGARQRKPMPPRRRKD
jgi:hypothetical protein